MGCRFLFILYSSTVLKIITGKFRCFRFGKFHPGLLAVVTVEVIRLTQRGRFVIGDIRCWPEKENGGTGLFKKSYW